MSDFGLRAGAAADVALVYRSTARSMHSSPYYRDVPGTALDDAGHLTASVSLRAAEEYTCSIARKP